MFLFKTKPNRTKQKVEVVPTLAKLCISCAFQAFPLQPGPPGFGLFNEVFTLGPRNEQDDSIWLEHTGSMMCVQIGSVSLRVRSVFSLLLRFVCLLIDAPEGTV